MYTRTAKNQRGARKEDPGFASRALQARNAGPTKPVSAILPPLTVLGATLQPPASFARGQQLQLSPPTSRRHLLLFSLPSSFTLVWLDVWARLFHRAFWSVDDLPDRY